MSLSRAIFAALAAVRRLMMAEERRFIRRFVWTVFLLWGVVVAARSVPYYCFMSAARDAANRGRFVEAEQLFTLALHEADQFGALSDLRERHALIALADVLACELKLGPAERLYKRALDIECSGTRENLYSSEIEYKLASVLFRQGQYAEARNYLERALGVRSKLLGPKHYLAATTRFALARTLRRLGDVQGAENLYVLALKNWPEATARDKAALAVCLRDYATFLSLSNRNEESKNLLLRADAIDVPVLTNVQRDFQQFAYLVTFHILDADCKTFSNSKEDLLDGELAPSAVKQLQQDRRFPATYPELLSQERDLNAKGQTDEIEFFYVEQGKPDAAGLIPMQVAGMMRILQNGNVVEKRKFLLKYTVGLGTKSKTPVVASCKIL
jgi:tetratricopeptide (TPR) repeat protein